MNSFDDSARIPCGDLDSLEHVLSLSWFKDDGQNRLEIADIGSKDAEKVPGFEIDASGALVISKAADEDFSLADIANYFCVAVRDAVGGEVHNSSRKLLVNFIVDKENLEPVVRGTVILLTFLIISMRI